jgi:hypothetical protein
MGEAAVAILVAVALFVVVPLWRWRARVYREACIAGCDAIFGIATPYGRVTTLAIAFTYQVTTQLRPVFDGLTKWLIEMNKALEPTFKSLVDVFKNIEA